MWLFKNAEFYKEDRDKVETGLKRGADEDNVPYFSILISNFRPFVFVG
jgi:hypothetical protein